MLITALSLMAALVAGQQSQSLGAAEGLRPLPTPPAVTATATPTNTQPQAAPRQVCRSIQVTGTRFPVRQCRNVQETEADRVEAREMLRRIQGSRTMPVG